MKINLIWWAFIVLIIQSSMVAQIDTTTAEYFPMHIGDIWEYEVELLPPETYQVRITGDTLMPNGKTYFVFKAAGYFSYNEYLRMDDSLRVFIYGGFTLPSSCNQENLAYNLSLPDSTLFIECFREYPEGNFPALLGTFDWYYSYLELTFSTKQFWGAYVDSVKNDTSWGSIFYREDWLAKGIGRAFSQPEAGSPERLLGAIIDGVQYGYVNSVDIKKENTCFKDQVILHPNYPNPFNPTTTIQFNLPVAANIELIVCDLLGRKIGTLVNTKQTAGNYRVEFDGSNLSSGIYLYQLKTDKGVTLSKKMILLR
jgi:hypothetical protein